MPQAADVADLELELTRHGLQYLQRSIDTGDGPSPTHQDLSFAIGDLAVAVEVLLKARLAREHWTLIVTDPDKFSPADLVAGTAKTVTPEQAFKRLTNAASVPWQSRHREHVESLIRLRNRTMHFTAANTPPEALATCWGQALNLAIWLMDTQFRTQATVEVSSEVEEALDAMSRRVGELASLRDVRLDSIRGDLSAADVRVECPRCEQWTLLLVEGEPAYCAFCVWRPVDGSEAAEEYASVVLGASSYEAVKDGGEPIVHGCLACGENALVNGIRPFVDPAAPSQPTIRCDPDLPAHWGCFRCGLTLAEVEIERCARCGELTNGGTEGLAVCESCVEDYMGRD